MGTDLDFALHLKHNKLSAAQFQQPTEQLEGETQSTEQPNLQFLLHVVGLLQRRMGNGFNNSPDPVAIVIQLNGDQRIIIAFPRAQEMRQRQQEQRRQRTFERLMQEIRGMQDNHNEFEDRPVRRQMHLLQPIPRFPQNTNQRELNFRQNFREQQRQVERHTMQDDLQNVLESSLNNGFLQEHEVDLTENSLPSQNRLQNDLQQLRHFNGSLRAIIGQQPQQEQYTRSIDQPSSMHAHQSNQPTRIIQPQPFEFDPTYPKNKTISPQQQTLPSTQKPNGQFNGLNQNSIRTTIGIHNQNRIEQSVDDQQDGLSCWRLFTRMIRRLFMGRQETGR